MRFQVNLATRPYIDARQFYLRWAALLVPLLLAAIVLSAFALRSLVSSRQAATRVRNLNSQIAELDRTKANAEAVLGRPENRDTRERSHFLNTLIARKSFSWTQVFSELEKIMPARVQVLSLRPEVTTDNQLQIVMSVAGDTRDNAVELVRRMEQSDTFRRPQVRAESSRQQGGAQVEFEIAAVYVPRLARPEPVPAANASGGGNARP